jgi:hypothetical protein
MKDILGGLQQLMGLVMPNGQLAPYNMPNQQVAGFNPYEQTGLQNEFNTAAGEMGNTGEATNLTGQILAGDQLNPATNPYLAATSEAMAAPTIAEYGNAIAPSEMGQAALAGAFGGSADASQRALNQFNLSNSLSNANEMLYGQNFQQAQQNQLNTLQNLGQIEAGANAPAEFQLSSGGVQQEQQQNQLNTNYQNALNQAQFPYQQLQYLASMLSGFGQGSGRSLNTQTEPEGGTGMQDLFGLGSLGLGAASLFGGGSASAASGIGSALSSLGPMLMALL